MPDGARGVRMPDFASDPPVRANLAGRNLGRHAQGGLFERAQPRDIDARHVDFPRREEAIDGLAHPRRRFSRPHRFAQTPFHFAHRAGVVFTAVDPDVRYAGIAPRDQQIAERRSDPREIIGNRRTETLTHGLDVIENARHEAGRRLDRRQAGKAVCHAFVLFVGQLTRRAMAQVRYDVFAARLRAVAQLVPERFNVATPH